MLFFLMSRSALYNGSSFLAHCSSGDMANIICFRRDSERFLSSGMAAKGEPTNEGRGMETDPNASNLQGELCL